MSMKLREAVTKYAEWCLEHGEVINLDEAANAGQMSTGYFKILCALMNAEALLGDLDLNDREEVTKAYAAKNDVGK